MAAAYVVEAVIEPNIAIYQDSSRSIGLRFNMAVATVYRLSGSFFKGDSQMLCPVFQRDSQATNPKKYWIASVAGYQQTGKTKREAHNNLSTFLLKINSVAFNQVAWIAEDSSFFKK